MSRQFTTFSFASYSTGTAILQFGDGVQGMRLPGGSPSFSPKYNSGAGAAGNVFTGVVPLGSGQFALLDAPAGGGASVHAQVLNFDGTNFTQRSNSNLPALSTRNTRADVWLFQTEPFVNRDPGFIASINSPDWSDSLSGLPGALNVVREGDGGTSAGLSSATTTNLGAPPSGSAFGLPNQFNAAISLFSYSGPRAAEAVAVKISPTPGPYVAPLSISFSVLPAGAGVQYRAGSADSWHAYTASFQITNDATIQFYGTNGSARGSLQFASYTLGGAATNPPPPVNLGSSNPPPPFPTNAIVLSANGTVFYGRRSANNFGTIWAINLDGSGDTYITTGARPRVSRDGRRLAFLRENNPFGNQGNVWMRDMQSGLETRLFSNPDFVVCYDWEPNAAALLTDYFCNIWDLNTNGGGGLSAVVAGDCYDDAPVRNPVDNRIAFHNVNPSSSVAGLYLAAANGGARQRIISSVVGATWPAWSPDGQWLAFSDGNSAASLDNGTNLWVAQPGGTSLNQITALTAPNRLPHGALWSPDGDALVTAGTIFNTNGLWIIPLTPDLADCDGPPIRLPTTPGDAIDFAGSIVVAPSTQLVVTQAPGLFIRQTPEVVVVYWNTNFVGYVLESETNLLSRAWTPVGGPYFLNAPYFEYWEARNSLSSQKYFRLRAPGVFVLSPPPVLAIQWQTNTAVLSWSALLTGFTLQSKTDLSPAIPLERSCRPVPDQRWQP